MKDFQQSSLERGQMVAELDPKSVVCVLLIAHNEMVVTMVLNTC